MTITLNITADTASDFFKQLAGLNNGFTGVGTIAFQPEVLDGPIMPELAKEPIRRTRQAKAAEPEVAVATPIVQPEVAVEAPVEQEVGKPSAGTATGTDGTTANQNSAPASAEAPAKAAVELAPLATEKAPAGASPPLSSGKVLDFDKDVAPIVLDYVKSHTKAWVVAVLNEFGVGRASEMEAAQWPELINALNDKAGA